MELVNVLHMNGGLGETSYANNCVLQGKVISRTKLIVEEAITEVYKSMVRPKILCMAELGCSSGPTSLLMATELVKIVHQLSLQHGHHLPEFQILLNDLPGNDFNSIFQSLLPTFQTELKQELGPGFGPCFVSGVPGSFYTRLFPTKSLHFVHSSYGVMWLSKVPEGLELNKDNICMATKSPENVMNAYYEQFQRDFSTFLKCRSEEIVVGGRMVLTILGEKNENIASKESCYIWELLALSLKEMVFERATREKYNLIRRIITATQGINRRREATFIQISMSLAHYMPSLEEVRKEVENEGPFNINQVETSEIRWSACGKGLCSNEGYNVTKEHFGESVIDQLFHKYNNIISEENAKFINFTVSVTRIN